MYEWLVCPIQGRQLKDVREEDIIGDFRFCNTYRGGGGYDQFPKIAKSRGLSCTGDIGLQFVVQLFGCHLDCPYCYVTRDGINGKHVKYTTEELVNCYYWAFVNRPAGVFHLMGGAPALYLKYWTEIKIGLDPDVIFHSDLLLTEGDYNIWPFRIIKDRNTLLAINIKGVTRADYYRNTGKELDTHLFWRNLEIVQESGVGFYLTFTNPDKRFLEEFKALLTKRCGENILKDHFVIDLIDYKALE